MPTQKKAAVKQKPTAKTTKRGTYQKKAEVIEGVEVAVGLLRQGHSKRAAARLAGIPHPTLLRHLKSCPRIHQRSAKVSDALLVADDLIKKGVSTRRAAEVTGVSRSTIRKKATLDAKLRKRQAQRMGAAGGMRDGTHPHPGPPPETGEGVAATPLAYDVVQGRHRATERCSGCGAMVLMPCVACSAKAERSQR